MMMDGLPTSGIASVTDFQKNVIRRLKLLETITDVLSSAGGGAGIIEGTFTPAWAGTVTPGTYTYVNQVGFYSLIGNLMFMWGHMRISSIDTPPSDDMWITTDLPAPAPFSDASFFWPGAFTFQRVSNFNLLPNTIQLTLVGWDNSGQLAMFPEQVFDDATFSLVSAATFNAAAADVQVSFSGTYRIEP